MTVLYKTNINDIAPAPEQEPAAEPMILQELLGIAASSGPPCEVYDPRCAGCVASQAHAEIAWLLEECMETRTERDRAHQALQDALGRRGWLEWLAGLVRSAVRRMRRG